MNKTVKRIVTMALALTLCLALAAPALADDIGAAENKQTYVYIDKDLVMPAAATVPTVGFTFKLEANTNPKEGLVADGWEIHHGDTTGVTYVGSNGVTTPNVSFTPTHATTAYAAGSEICTSGEKYATESLKIDFKGVTFTEPGVYRYKITEVVPESATKVAGITYDEETVYYIDIYVWYNDDGDLEIGDIIVTDEDTLTGAEDTNGDGIIDNDKKLPDDPDEKIDAVEPTTPPPGEPSPNPDDKIPGDGDDDDNDPDTPKAPTTPNAGKSSADFINKYAPLALTLKKTVTGNQGSKTDKFDFAIDLDVEDGVYYVTNANATSGIEYVGWLTVKSGKGTFAPKSGDADYVQLADGDKISILLPYDYSYTIAEQGAADYKTSYAAGAAGWDAAAWTSNSNADKITKTKDEQTPQESGNDVVAVNYKNGTVPTGVLLTIAPFVILMVIGVAGAAVVMTKKKYN